MQEVFIRAPNVRHFFLCCQFLDRSQRENSCLAAHIGPPTDMFNAVRFCEFLSPPNLTTIFHLQELTGTFQGTLFMPLSAAQDRKDRKENFLGNLNNISAFYYLHHWSFCWDSTDGDDTVEIRRSEALFAPSVDRNEVGSGGRRKRNVFKGSSTFY